MCQERNFREKLTKQLKNHTVNAFMDDEDETKIKELSTTKTFILNK